ncbi:MAG: Methyltransferase type 11, partial [uncultured Friedmanniella sp.]
DPVPRLHRPRALLAACLRAGGVRRGGRVRRGAAARRRADHLDGARAGQRRRQQRRAPEARVRDDAGRPLAGDAGRLPAAQPRVRAPAGRHADAAAGPAVRRGVRARRHRVHDDRGRAPASGGDGLRALPAGRRRGAGARPHRGELRARHRPRRDRRGRRQWAAVPLLVNPRGLDRHDGDHRLRLPGALRRRQGLGGPRHARSRLVPAGDVAAGADRGRVHCPLGGRGDPGEPAAAGVLRRRPTAGLLALGFRALRPL